MGNKMRAYWIFRLGISSNIDPLGRFMHGAKPVMKKNFHIHKVKQGVIAAFFSLQAIE
jgi:hypothetical protein